MLFRKTRLALLSILVILIFTGAKQNQNSIQMNYTLLSLGDSYTIGESLLLSESFPYQVAELLRKKGFEFNAPEIIAKTGWTTDELQSAINEYQFLSSYNFVTLLIGVNNQYRARSVDDYKPEFEKLLNQAITFSGNHPEHVIVISIPDWGVTPFAEGRDREQIADEINEYNKANKSISEKYMVNYIDITPGSREALKNRDLLAADGLHPSASEYARWAERIAAVINQHL